MYGIKKRTFSVLYKFINPVPILYLMYGIKKTYFFDFYKFITKSLLILFFIYELKKRTFSMFINSVQIPYLSRILCTGSKTYIFSTLQIPYRFRTNSVFCPTSGQLQVFQNSIKNTLIPYLFFLKRN